MHRHPFLAQLEASHGIVLPTVQDWLNPDLAMDAQPASVTVASGGVPAFLTNYMDPKVIRVLVTPNVGARILGEVQKGDWTTRTMMFVMVESTGEVSSYGDWNDNGVVGANAQFPQRQSYHFQTHTIWGALQLDIAGKAGINWATECNVASAVVLDKFLNKSYFYGVAGLQNWGYLTDPKLSAAILPGLKAGGGRTWAVATPNEIFDDLMAEYNLLVSQSQGIITIDNDIVVATAPTVATYLNRKNSFGLSAAEMLKGSIPKYRLEVATQYATTAGNIVQMIAESVEGQETGYAAFTEKMRAHPMITKSSGWTQKKSAGTFGAVLLQPFAVAQMIGV